MHWVIYGPASNTTLDLKIFRLYDIADQYAYREAFPESDGRPALVLLILLTSLMLFPIVRVNDAYYYRNTTNSLMNA